MSRFIKVGAAQMGPIARSEGRREVVERQLALLREARGEGCDLVVFPELALTTFFPRWLIEDRDDIDAFFEKEMPGNETAPLFEEAKRYGIGFHLGYAELADEGGEVRHYNTSILVDEAGEIVGKYRKIHLPGTAEPIPGDRGHHLEKRYFDVGNLGFGVWQTMGAAMGICICNDRRWPETYRVMGLQGVELIMLGYNSPVGTGESFQHDALEPFHNHLVMQSGAYQNATWVVGVAKCGNEEGYNMIGQSAIIAPSGEIAAMATSLEDELVVHKCNLDLATLYRRRIFNFAAHRRPEHYRLIVDRIGAELPLHGRS